MATECAAPVKISPLADRVVVEKQEDRPSPGGAGAGMGRMYSLASNLRGGMQNAGEKGSGGSAT